MWVRVLAPGAGVLHGAGSPGVGQWGVGSGKLKERTLVVGTLPNDPGQADTAPPPQPEAQAPPRPADPMATRLEAPAKALEYIAQELSTADTAREQVPEPTADTARQAVPADTTADTARQAAAASTADTIEARAQRLRRSPARVDALSMVGPPGRARAQVTAPQAVAHPPAAPQVHAPQPTARAAQQAAPPAQAPQPRFVRPLPQAPAMGAPPALQPQPVPEPPPEPKVQPRPRAARKPKVSDNDAAVARGLAKKARRLMDKGKYDEALSIVHKAMGVDRGNAEHAALCGYLVHLSGATASGQIDQCLTLFEHAIQLDPQHAGAHYYKGLVLKDAGRIREAMEVFERTLDLNPDHLEAARQLRDHGKRKNEPMGGGFGRLMKGLKK